MCACWENTPEDRPSFSTLVEILGDLLQTCVRQVHKHIKYIHIQSILNSKDCFYCLKHVLINV